MLADASATSVWGATHARSASVSRAVGAERRGKREQPWRGNYGGGLWKLEPGEVGKLKIKHTLYEAAPTHGGIAYWVEVIGKPRGPRGSERPKGSTVQALGQAWRKAWMMSSTPIAMSATE